MDQYDDEIMELEVVAAAVATAVNLVLLLVEATQYDRAPSVNRREHRNENLRFGASKHLVVEEHVAIFLLIVGHDTRFKHAQASTMRSLETISKYFHVVLKYVLRLGKDLIKHATPDLSFATGNNHHAWANTYFKDCVGAVDGTFVPTTVPLEDQPRILRAAVNDDMHPFTVPRGVMARYCVFLWGVYPDYMRHGRRHNPRSQDFKELFIEELNQWQRLIFCLLHLLRKRGMFRGGVALEEEKAPPVVEVEEAEDVEDLGGMAVRDVHG
ncbi:hypothetical protein GIB67_037404 [Kingdonia uniflora]|uniref:DUF8040 domain-containing protein n=1 Tax=Kingdonia uniflora TaxID=39325 RepID=A0A7J7M8K1_9MAGN|nr:hypothetical protein GIB67_037404 [Kingdonia uniflora]